jgi:hypothetical protein
MALAVVLERYPEGVVNHVTDPRTGIAGESKWLPTIADVRHACETAMKPIRDEEARAARRVESEATLQTADNDRSKRKTFAELAAMYPDIIGTKERRPATEGEKAKILADLQSRRAYFRSPLEPSDRIRQTLERENNPASS